jgi:hypothetical protein
MLGSLVAKLPFGTVLQLSESNNWFIFYVLSDCLVLATTVRKEGTAAENQGFGAKISGSRAKSTKRFHAGKTACR